MKTLVIGADGQLGSEVSDAFADTELCRASRNSGDVRLERLGLDWAVFFGQQDSDWFLPLLALPYELDFSLPIGALVL